MVLIDADRITSVSDFHDVFAEALGFPDWYGRNMDAWIDLMTHLDSDREMTSFGVQPGQVVTLQVDNVTSFRARLPQLYADLVECSAFVNWRRLDVGETAYLCLSFHE